MLILSIPFLSKEIVEKNLTQIEFDLFEIRLDYLKSLKNIPINLFSSKTIATIRDVNEGGKNYFLDEERLQFYKKVIAEKNSLIDCEVSFYRKFGKHLVAKNTILSYHNFKKDVIEKNKIKEILSYSNSVKFVKIALNISNYKKLKEISDFIKGYENVIFLSMGDTGIVSRLLYKRLNSVATYIGLDDLPTSSGQLSCSQIERWFDPRVINKHTQIGGIAGGKQVLHSIGLDFYNNAFRKDNAVYLPFVTNDLKDLLNWLSYMNFYGLSVTMPLKKAITKIFNSKLVAANLFLPPNKLFNTDKTAFERAITYLKIDKKDSILIYGSGGLAITAITTFPNSKAYLISRNAKICDKLVKKFNLKSDIPTECDILINCTPLGLSEDFFNESKIKIKPKKIIDSPYNLNKDTSLIKFAKANKVPYVDGKLFWKWQSEMQLKLFKERIKNLI